MMYSSQRAQAIQKKDVAYLSAGIHDNILLDSYRTETSVAGNTFIELKFVSKDGQSVTVTEWEPSKGPNTNDADFNNKCDNQFKRIDQILSCFYPDDKDREFEGENFKDLVTWVINKLDKADKSILLRIKVVYNDKGYTTLPKYAKYTFIEPMSKVNEGKSVIVKLGIDQFDKPVIADTEKEDPNPLMQVDNININDNPNGLPF